MKPDSPVKVVIENAQLHRSSGDFAPQRVATVYLEREEYHVLAPSKAEGNALEWFEQFAVRRNGEYEVRDWRGSHVLETVKEELERLIRDTNRVVDLNPDGRFYDAYICATGHVKSSIGGDFKGEHCERCGAVCIDECPACRTPIRGEVFKSRIAGYVRPEFCHHCGAPYPWMRERLQTAQEVLAMDNAIPTADRKRLWNDINYILSNPKSELVPAKKRVVMKKLEGVAQFTRDFVTEVLAKVAVEAMKP